MTRVSLLLNGASFVFAAILALEVLPASGTTANEAASPRKADPPTARMEPPPLDAWADIALSRPVFSPDRRAPASAAGPHTGLPRLTGIIGAGDDTLAIFQPDNGKSVTAGRSAIIGDWTVAEIEPGSVTLTRGSSRTTLQVRFADQKVTEAVTIRTSPMILHEKRTNPFLQP